MTWTSALLPAVAILLLVLIIRPVARAVAEERQRQIIRAHRENERRRAAKIMAADLGALGRAPSQARSPVTLQEDEKLYFEAEASHLELESDGTYARKSRGFVAITDQALIYQHDGGAHRTGADDVERVATPAADVLEVVTFVDTFTREEAFAYYQLRSPLVAAAYLSRLGNFELLLDPGAPAVDRMEG